MESISQTTKRAAEAALFLSFAFIRKRYFFVPPVWPRPSRISLPLNCPGSRRTAAALSPTLGEGPL